MVRDFDSDRPPFRLSSAMPRGWLPMPVLPPIGRRVFERRFGGKRRVELAENLKKYKKFKRLSYLPLDIWLSARGKLDPAQLFTAYLAEPDRYNLDESITSPLTHQPHNSIDRASGKVMARGGFYFSKAWFPPPDAELDLYLETDDPTDFERMFDHLKKTGFGADRNVGRGQFTWRRDAEFDPATFNFQGEAKLNLSVCATTRLAEIEGAYRPFVKQGRAYVGYGQVNPFKRPFLAFEEGSVFTGLPKSGFVLEDVHPAESVVQICWPLTLPITPEEPS